MCLKVTLRHACNHDFKDVWRPCDNPLRRSLALPRPRQPHKFIPCGEGINAGLPAFKKKKPERRADEKVCPLCEAEMRVARAEERRSKGAPKERLRREKYQRLWPWLQGESDVRHRPVENGCVPELAHYADSTAARAEATVHQVHELTTNIILEENLFRKKVVNEKAVRGKISEDSRTCYPVAELDSWSMNQHSSSARYGSPRIVDTAEQGGSRQATLQECAIPVTEKRQAPIREAAEEEAEKQQWLGDLSQEQSSAKDKAARKYNAKQKVPAGKQAEEKVVREKVANEDALKRKVQMAEAIRYEPVVPAAEKEVVGGKDINYTQ